MNPCRLRKTKKHTVPQLALSLCVSLPRVRAREEAAEEEVCVFIDIRRDTGCSQETLPGTPPFVVLCHLCGALRYRALTAATGSGVGSLVHFLTKLELSRRASISDSCRCRMVRNFFSYSLSSLIFTVSCPQRGGNGEGEPCTSKAGFALLLSFESACAIRMS